MRSKFVVLFSVLLFPTISFASNDRPIDPDIFPPTPQIDPVIKALNCNKKARDKYERCMDSVEDLYNLCESYKGKRSRRYCFEDVWDMSEQCDDTLNKEILACDGVPPPVEPIIPEDGQDDDDHIVPEPIPDPNANFSPFHRVRD